MATDKWTQKLLTWLETQPAETQTRIKGMLEKGLIKEIKAELPAGWASAAPSTKSKARRKSYCARSGGIKGGDGKLSANYWARKVLWSC